MRMQQLGGKAMVYSAVDGGMITDIAQRDKLLSICTAPRHLCLKKGAEVILIKDIDDGLVTGSVGRVIAFMDERAYDQYIQNEEEEEDPSRQLPVVRFPKSDGTSRDLLCSRELWKIELSNGEVLASRFQVPLIPVNF